ncbi:MAG: Deoxyribose-phosphate aldolase [Candidatus Heimdallarchaeota archaeon AB_125]|nr:MAG: Deoxyribose-phosphate aldolase [Candidatus Heimdallarchaeota archaeon AB_125]
MYSLKISPEKLANMIDHTNLKPFATKKDIRKLCEEALENNFAAVCVNSEHISFCTEMLKKSEIEIAAVVGFPLGASTSKTKEAETQEAVGFGAHEIDMVMDIGSFREGNYFAVGKDIGKVVQAADGAIVKVILETGFLTDEQITKASEISKNSGAHYVKTSTGFGPMGAFIDHIALMRQAVGKDLGVKAAGGIRTARTAVRLINASADRLGASAGVAIVNQLKKIIDEGGWFYSSEDRPEDIYSWGAADPKKQPKDVYDFYIKKKKEFIKR